MAHSSRTVLWMTFFSVVSLVLFNACSTGGSSSTTSTPPPQSSPAPTVSLSLNPTSVSPGNPATLTWTTTNATSITIDNGVGSFSNVNSSATVNPTATTIYTATATGAGGSATAQVTLKVSADPPTISLTSAPGSIVAGQLATLTWNTTNAVSVSIDNGLGEQKTVNGSISVTPTDTTVYTATATNSDGTPATAKTTVTVTPSTAPAVSLSASPNIIVPGGITQLSWSSVNATKIVFSPPLPTDADAPPITVNGAQTISLSKTTTYTATVTDANGVSAQSVATITVDPNAPVVALAASPSNIMPGQSTKLNWNTKNVTSLVIDNGIGSGSTPAGFANVSPTTTTTYTATGTGPLGTVTASATVTMPAPTDLAVSLKANPPSIGAGGSTTLSWITQNATTFSMNNGVVVPGPTGSVVVSPTQSTTYTITVTDANGATKTASASVGVASTGDPNQIKHIIIFVQENRSFDNYFGQLGKYMAAKGFSGKFEGIPDSWVLPDHAGTLTPAYHMPTVCHENLSPDWNQGRGSMDAPCNTSTCVSSAKMDRFLVKAKSTTNDPNGHRAIGYYDQSDLPYYYELATQFATSDTWHSPLVGPTVPNRMYLFTGTSFGHIHSDPPPPGGFTQPTIFQRLREAGVSWRYYYQDDSVFLSQFSNWPIDQGAVYPLSSFATDVQSEAALPQVVFIERGSHVNLDEHPLNNIQKGAASVKQVIDTLMNSPTWATSVFILTYDENGGLADHVPPVPMPAPDDITPIKIKGDAPGDFSISGFRVPLIVVSPWVRPHFVSHVPRDFTAMLKLIETRFGVAPLTRRDAAQDNMYEFFDFSSPHRQSVPSLPAQPTTGLCSYSAEAP